MSITSLTTYNDATKAGMPFWRLQISNWGNRGATSDANSLRYVAADAKSAQYIVIGPDSTVDSAVIDYADLGLTPYFLAKEQAFIASPITSPVGDPSQISFTISTKRPGVMLPGGLAIDVNTDPNSKPFGIRAAQSSLFGDTYRRDNSTTASFPFGGAEPLCELPTLQLLLYTSVPTVAVPGTRAPMLRSTQQTVINDANEHLLAIWPVMGRGCKTVYFRTTDFAGGAGDFTGTVRVGQISYFAGNVSGGAVYRPVEDTVGNVAVAGASGAQCAVSTAVPCQWLAAYYTRTAGTNNIIYANLAAYDDCSC